ncbi:MAG: hypothetical protein ACXAE3_12120 [Candidatus Kariarchaeaceae archaeon]|jgi:hypothetical protein
MIITPEKKLVFSSESDDSVGLQIYRLLYADRSFDILFMEDEYKTEFDMIDYYLPSDSGDPESISTNDLMDLFKEVVTEKQLDYSSLGLFHDFDLGFTFTKSMIDDLVATFEPEELRDELREVLSKISYVNETWDILNWEASIHRLVENFSFAINSSDELAKVERIIQESSDFIELVYPELFELFIFAGEFYEQTYVYAKTASKLFCLSTTVEGPYTEFMYDLDDIDFDQLDGDDSIVLDLDANLLKEWYSQFNPEIE